ncbi:MAG: OB-fold domain-containing protein [Actinomycetota bacterium]|nr:OB-fold domain-containing protein [Actinomycetota bacterium]
MPTPLAPEITTWPDDPVRLVGSRCDRCSATAFPAQTHCPRCSAAAMTEVLLPREGTLISWTTQGFPPGPPYLGAGGADFTPFGVGLVELGSPGDPVIRVEGRLTESDPARLEFGMPVELTMLPFATRDGDEILTFAFRPV